MSDLTHQDLNGIKMISKVALIIIGSLMTLGTTLVAAGVIAIFGIAKDVSAMKSTLGAFDARLARVERQLDTDRNY